MAAAEVPRDPLPSLGEGRDSPGEGRHGSSSRPIGVLLANVGSPDGPEPAAVRRFLREFLSDPQVVDLPRAVWLPILHGLVLPLRSRSSSRLYARIWTEEGSPLIVNTRRQERGLASRLGPGFRATSGMRYGHPSLATALAELEGVGCRRVVLVPMFPQFSFATSGTIHVESKRIAGDRRIQLEIRTMPSFCADAGYVGALAERVREARRATEVYHHVFSFHGLPEKSVARGDPYRIECEKTAAALARALDLPSVNWTVSFQSRFGRRWLGPFTDEVVRSLATRHPRLLVAMPGFTADCLETLEEIGIRLRETFREAGGEELIVVPALNDHASWLDALATLVRRTAGIADDS